VVAEAGLTQRPGDDLPHHPAVVAIRIFMGAFFFTSMRLLQLEILTGSAVQAPYRPLIRSALGTWWRDQAPGPCGSDSWAPGGAWP
jgi:hypothetical protein